MLPDKEPEFSSRGYSGCILLINVYDPGNFGTAARSLESCYRMIKHTMQSKTHNVGLCLFGTRETETSFMGLNNIIELMTLKFPSLEDLKYLKKIDLDNYGQSNSMNLSDALWQCSRMFASCKKSLSDRTVMLLTRLDNPPPAADQRSTLTRVYDLKALSINLQIVNVSECEYKIDPFYVEIIKALQCKLDDVKIPKPLWKPEDIELVIFQRCHKNLSSSLINFHISDDFFLATGIYKLCRTKYGPKKVYLHRDTNAIVTTSSTIVKATQSASSESSSYQHSSELDNDIPLLKSELCLCQHLGGETLEFHSEEFTTIRNYFGPPSLKLLGFKPQSSIQKEKWFLKPCLFLFPNEDAVNGTTVAFLALHKACVQKEVVAIGILFARMNAKPQTVALIPTILDGYSPAPGFDIIYLPQLEDKKEFPEAGNDDLGDENYLESTKVVFMKDTLKKLEFNYSRHLFKNPKLNTQYQALEALALDEENTEPLVDTTLPNSVKFENIDAEMFESTFGPFAEKSVKRSTAGENSAAKRQHIEPPDQNLLKVRLRGNDIHRYTVADLKHILRWKNPPNMQALTGVKKDELVKLVYEHCKLDE